VFAVAAEPAPGAVLLRDDQIIGLPTAITPGAPFGPGFRYKVEVSGGVSAPVGAILLSTGAKSVAGRVVSVENTSITVEQVTLAEALPRLDIRQKLDLTKASSGDPGVRPQSRTPGLRPLAEKEFKIGTLDCKVEGSLGSLEFNKKDYELSPLQDLTYDIAWNDTEKTIVVSGQPKVTFELEAVVKGQIEGKVGCKAMLKDYVIPLPGPLGIFLGAAVPVGIGFDVGAKAVVTEAGVNFKGDASAKLSFGFRCLSGACTSVNEAESSGNLTPKWIPPQFDLADTRFEPEAQVFAWAMLEGGARFSSTLRFDAIEAQAGFKLGGSFASEAAQAKAADYASSYKLGFVASVGPAGAAETFLRLVEVAVALLQFEMEIPLGDSPVGASLKGSPGSFKTGDTVTFALALDPMKAKFPLVGYNVESVRVYRKDVRPDGSVSLILANEAQPQGEQVDFQIPWVATLDGSVGSNFVAFVKTKLLDLRLEAATSTSFELSGGLTSPTGVKLPATDGLATIVPPNTSGNPGGAPLPTGKFYFSQVAEGILVCSKQERKAQTAYFEVAFAKDTALAPGTYTFTPALGPIASGTFSSQVVGVGGLPLCTENYLDFTGGTLVLTEASTSGFVGTVTLINAGGTTTGAFSIPACAKTFAEFGALSFVCKP